ncbi:MAG TPA: sodium-translocating pyrophosphatase, partial [Longimicrobium sp.]|nr:sodium-translocating pyrophosphatase [Longimicrobium sp.]
AATGANARTAEAARADGAPAALRVAWGGASVMGQAVAGLGLFGVGLVHFLGISRAGVFEQERFEEFAAIASGFALGASVVALFGRLAGGVFANAAGVAGSLVSQVEAGLPADDPRNPAAVATHVGRSVGGAAGMGADLLESQAAAVVAAVAIGVTQGSLAGYDNRIAAVGLPILALAAGLLASALGIFLVRFFERRGAAFALRWATVGAAAVFVLIMALVVWSLAFDMQDPDTGAEYRMMGPYWALLAGAAAGVAVGLVSEWWAATRGARQVADAAPTGPATSVITGLASGLESVAVPIVALCAAIAVGYETAGLYGIAVAAVGMLSTLALTVAVEAFGPIADTAGGVAGMSHLGPETRRVTDELSAAGSATAAVGKGFAIASAALAAIALYAAYAATVRLRTVNLVDPYVVIGFLLGGAVPFVVAALTTSAIGRAAAKMVEEVRRQFRETPGLLEGDTPPDSARCIDISTRAALREMAVPGVVAVLVPVLVGGVLGVAALGGVLAGATLTGLLLALWMSNAGGAFASARARIEAGAHGGRGSDAHKAALVADAVGDPFRDAVGPAMNILIKLMAVLALVLAPWFLTLPSNAGHVLEIENVPAATVDR